MKSAIIINIYLAKPQNYWYLYIKSKNEGIILTLKLALSILMKFIYIMNYIHIIVIDIFK